MTGAPADDGRRSAPGDYYDARNSASMLPHRTKSDPPNSGYNRNYIPDWNGEHGPSGDGSLTANLPPGELGVPFRRRRLASYPMHEFADGYGPWSSQHKQHQSSQHSSTVFNPMYSHPLDTNNRSHSPYDHHALLVRQNCLPFVNESDIDGIDDDGRLYNAAAAPLPAHIKHHPLHNRGHSFDPAHRHRVAFMHDRIRHGPKGYGRMAHSNGDDNYAYYDNPVRQLETNIDAVPEYLYQAPMVGDQQTLLPPGVSYSPASQQVRLSYEMKKLL